MRQAGILSLFILSLFFLQSCKVPVSTGIATDTWYICDELNIALKFETPAKGIYISTQKALATPRVFRLKHSRTSSQFIFTGRSKLQGSLSLVHDRFYVLTKNSKIEFRQYVTAAFPKAPYRYKDEVFSEITVNEIVYGKAPGYYSSKTIEKRENKTYTQVIFDVAEGIGSNIIKREIPLQMDIYQPIGDNISQRPLIVLLHAGAFIAGDKRDELISRLAENYAKRGYVVASVNYRLGYIFAPGRYSNLERAMYSAVQDVRAAIRFLSYHQTEYRIDPNLVFIGGNSAGGFLSLFTAFMDDTEVWQSVGGSIIRMQSDLGCLDCSTNNLYGPFGIRGVINMWGAVDDLKIIKKQDQIPILSIHGDNDKVVPYGYNYPFTNVNAKASAFFSRRIHGSASILEHTGLLGIDHTLYTFEGLGHEPHFNHDHMLIEENYEIIQNLVLSFVNNLVITTTERLWGPAKVSGNDLVAEYWIEQGKYKAHTFECDDCLIVRQTPNSARVVWLAGSDGFQLRVAGVGPHGQVFVDTLRVEPIFIK